MTTNKYILIQANDAIATACWGESTGVACFTTYEAANEWKNRNGYSNYAAMNFYHSSIIAYAKRDHLKYLVFVDESTTEEV